MTVQGRGSSCIGCRAIGKTLEDVNFMKQAGKAKKPMLFGLKAVEKG